MLPLPIGSCRKRSSCCELTTFPTNSFTGKADPYLVVTVGRQVQRTTVKKKTLSPSWWETMVFNDVDASSIHVELFDEETVGKDRSMGSFTVPILPYIEQKPYKLRGLLEDSSRQAAGVVYLSLTSEDVESNDTCRNGSKDSSEAMCTWQSTVSRASVYRSSAAVSKTKSRLSVSKGLADHEQQERMEQIYLVVPYLKSITFLLLALVDLISALVLHLGSNSDFLCALDSDDLTPQVSEPTDMVIVVLLWILLAAHLVVFGGQIFRVHETGRVVGLRYFYSTQYYNLEDILTHWLQSILLVLSLSCFLQHESDCLRWAHEGEMPEHHVSIVKTHAHLHMTRAIFTLMQCFGMRDYLRKQLQIVVSANKRRFVSPEMNLDLDLTYICDRVIAMALPSVKDAVHRNDIRHVARFFATRHYGTFLVYNLCENHEEEGNGNYDTKMLFDQVQKLPFPDHNAPPLKWLVRFCQNASFFLNACPFNVVCIHCRGGKGRTGLFISSLMLWTRMKPTAAGALDEFARRRTLEMKGGQSVQGVTGPGQVRYIHYLEAYIYHNVDIFADSWMLLNSLALLNVFEDMMPNSSLSFVIECNNEIQYDHGKLCGLTSYTEGRHNHFCFGLPQIALRGDVRVRFFLFDVKDDVPLESLRASAQSASTRPTRVRGALGPGAASLQYGVVCGKSWFYIAFHTAFLEQGRTIFYKHEIDGVYNLAEKKYPKDFGIELDVASEPQDVDLPSELMRSDKASRSPRDARATVPPDSPLRRQTPAGAGWSDALGTQVLAAENLGIFPMVLSSKVKPSVRHFAMILKAREILQRLSAFSETFSRSESLICDMDSEHTRTVLIVSKGEVLESHESNAGDVDIETLAGSMQNSVYGRHTVLGMIEFMLGPTGVPSTLKSLSNDLQLQRIAIPIESAYVPLQIPGTKLSESGIIYSYFAQEMLSKVRSIRSTLARAAFLSNAKKDLKNGHSLNEQKILNQITLRFGVPMTERLLYTGYASLMDENYGVVCHGRFCLFRSWIVFLSKRKFARAGQDVLISLRNVTKASQKGEEVRIVVKHEPRDSATSSRASSYPAQSTSTGVMRNTTLFRRLSNQASSLRSSLSPDDDFLDKIYDKLSIFRRRSARVSERMSSSHRVLKRRSTDQEIFGFPDTELADLVSTMIHDNMKDAHYEVHAESTEWVHRKLKILQYQDSKFGYFLPGEEESESDNFLQQLSSISSSRTYKPGESMHSYMLASQTLSGVRY